MAGDEIDGSRGTAVRIQIPGSSDPSVELRRAAGVSLYKPAQAIPVFSVPFRPAVPGGETSDLVEAACIPCLRDQLGSAQHGVVSQRIDEGRGHHGSAVLVTGQDRRQVEAEAVDMVERDPVAEAVQDMISDDRVVTVHRVAAAAEIEIFPVGIQQIVGSVVDTLVRDHRTVFIAFRSVIEYDIEYDLDPVLVQLSDRVLQLVRFHAERSRGAVPCLGCEEAQRRISPVIAEILAARIVGILKFIEGKNRHQFNAVYPQRFEIGYFFHDSRVCPRIPGLTRRISCKSSHMHLIDDQILHGNFQRLVIPPVIILADELAPVYEAGVCL